MTKQLGLLLLLMLLSCYATRTAWADPTLAMENASNTYQPGMPYEFEISIKNIMDLNLFSIDLVLTAENGTQGVDYYFDETLTIAHPTHYVFGVEGVTPFGFSANAGTNATSATLNLSDLLQVGEEVDPMPGVNEMVASVVVQTTGNVGRMTFDFDLTFLELLNSNGEYVPELQDAENPFLPDFSTLIVETPGDVSPIPEPTGVLALLAATLFVGARRSRIRCR